MNSNGNKLKKIEYGKQYLKPKELKVRQCVYISRDTHETMTDIVKRIGQKGLTIGAYINTILQGHLQEHKDEINALYCKRINKIIK